MTLNYFFTGEFDVSHIPNSTRLHFGASDSELSEFVDSLSANGDKRYAYKENLRTVFPAIIILWSGAHHIVLTSS